MYLGICQQNQIVISDNLF